MNSSDGTDLESSELLFNQRSSSPILLSTSSSNVALRQANAAGSRQQPTRHAQLAELFRLSDPEYPIEQPPINGATYSAPYPYRIPWTVASPPLVVTASEDRSSMVSLPAPSASLLRPYRPINRTLTSVAQVGRINQRGEPWSNRLQRIGGLHRTRPSTRSTAVPSSNFVGPYLPRCPPRQTSARANGVNARLVYPAYLVHQHTSSFARRGQHWLSPAVVVPGRHYSNEEIDLVLEAYHAERRQDSPSPWVHRPPYIPIITAAAAFAFGTAAGAVGSPQAPASGLPDTLIASIPRRYGSFGRDGGKNEQGECPICLNVCRDEWSKKLPICGHEFHAGCLDRWLLLKNNCPVCRRVAVVCN